MQRLKRVFDIDIKTCTECCGKLRVIACIEDPRLIAKIPGHVHQREALDESLARAGFGCAKEMKSAGASTPVAQGVKGQLATRSTVTDTLIKYKRGGFYFLSTREFLKIPGSRNLLTCHPNG
ncbi:MAG: hypothetical protein HKO99_13150 [Xanthomonadales bacterium]|nr:hypothetical protein [Xanthomonadales bacterium]